MMNENSKNRVLNNFRQLAIKIINDPKHDCDNIDLEEIINQSRVWVCRFLRNGYDKEVIKTPEILDVTYYSPSIALNAQEITLEQEAERRHQRYEELFSKASKRAILLDSLNTMINKGNVKEISIPDNWVENEETRKQVYVAALEMVDNNERIFIIFRNELGLGLPRPRDIRKNLSNPEELLKAFASFLPLIGTIPILIRSKNLIHEDTNTRFLIISPFKYLISHKENEILISLQDRYIRSTTVLKFIKA